MSNKNIWYLAGPFHQYQEDVKALAKERGLRIIDANATESRDDEAREVPGVTVKEAPALPVLVVGDHPGFEIEALRRELEAVGLIVESFAEQSLERPAGDDGATSSRLFQVLEAVNSGVQVLIDERDAETGKVEVLTKQNSELLEQIEALKAASASDPEIEAMKAALTAAGVAFRANASKESLEKLVSELPKE
ncbi:hypothetical protein HX890_12025 [Pseudomonas gingeri]|uniref:hypothetical protein n=1 Tax=Pseudomonas gingeri TaxID=117681 RepID=UPI00159FB5FC|nr:hypothetical protein [Pseudomonas gingeri]NWD74831.1 hypothetical protein [Pseudomonas gingeri]